MKKLNARTLFEKIKREAHAIDTHFRPQSLMCGLDQFDKNNFNQWYIVHQEHMKDDFFNVLQNDTKAQLLAIEVFSQSTSHAKGTSDYTSHDILDEDLFEDLLSYFKEEYRLFNYTLPKSIHDNPNEPVVHYSTLKKK